VTIRHELLAIVALITAVPVWAADSNAGSIFFRQQCALCHSAAPGDNGGAQGPSLIGLIGRKAASDANFGYTRELKASGLTWGGANLDRFLVSPTTVVPGTAMVIAVPDVVDRGNLIAYFQALNDGSFKAPAARTAASSTRTTSTPIPEQGGEWRDDRPGRVHRIDLAKLPAPTDTSATSNHPKLIDKPPGARLSVPSGFKAEVFSRVVQGPRAMRLAPNGDIFVTEMNRGRVVVMRPSANGANAASVEVFAQGLNLPYGMAFYPSGSDPQWLYIAENNRVVRYAYNVGAQHASGLPEVIVPQLYPGSGGHVTRDLVFSADGKRMFVSVGSLSNVAETMPKKSPGEIVAWESAHGLGTAWGPEENRAAVLVFNVGSATTGKVFAGGIRNCSGLTLQPATGDLWCTTNERDNLGDDLVPDYSTRVREGAFYGWPWYYMGNHEDERLAGQRPDLAGKVTVPDVLYQPHSASLNLVFYGATTGTSAFPREYLGDGFAVFHGSWNRSFRTGHKIVRVRMKNGVPTGEYVDFLVGFIASNGDAWGRPAALVVAADGSLLMSDDAFNLIYRISYAH
jgi:glucose/arabinose dehydrogenase/cytochrome c2